MFLLVNTFHRTPQTRGHVISRHRSQAAAFDAMSTTQRAVQRRLGRHHWLPMIVLRVDAAEQKSASEWVPVGVGSLCAEPEL